MASNGHASYVVVVLLTRSPNTTDIQLVLQREHRTGEARYLDGNVLLNDELADVAARELFEETGMTLTVDGLTLLHGEEIHVPLPDSKAQHLYVYDASVHVPYVASHLCISTKVKEVALPKSTVRLDGSYVVATLIAIDGVNFEAFCYGYCKGYSPYVGAASFWRRCGNLSASQYFRVRSIIKTTPSCRRNFSPNPALQPLTQARCGWKFGVASINCVE
jgi:hypothetical protein